MYICKYKILYACIYIKMYIIYKPISELAHEYIGVYLHIRIPMVLPVVHKMECICNVCLYA